MSSQLTFCLRGLERAVLILYEQWSPFDARYARIFVDRHYLFRETNIFRKRSSKNAASFEEQMMSKDKDPSILFEVKCGLMCHYT